MREVVAEDELDVERAPVVRRPDCFFLLSGMHFEARLKVWIFGDKTKKSKSRIQIARLWRYPAEGLERHTTAVRVQQCRRHNFCA